MKSFVVCLLNVELAHGLNLYSEFVGDYGSKPPIKIQGRADLEALQKCLHLREEKCGVCLTASGC